MKTLLEPFPVSVRVVTLPCLFAGKLHACLCRSWKTRVKGRDWYDFLFFVARGTQVNMPHLEARIAAVDWKQAAADALPFISDPRSIELWGPQLFKEAAGRIGGQK